MAKGRLGLARFDDHAATSRSSERSRCVWLGLLVEPEPLADLRHEAGHGANSTPLLRGRRLRGVEWLDWPCGQNPGRKPEGRQRVSTPEAMSLGEQSSSRRASTLWFCPRGLRPGNVRGL